jgi:hypothetical protein
LLFSDLTEALAELTEQLDNLQFDIPFDLRPENDAKEEDVANMESHVPTSQLKASEVVHEVSHKESHSKFHEMFNSDRRDGTHRVLSHDKARSAVPVEDHAKSQLQSNEEVLEESHKESNKARSIPVHPKFRGLNSLVNRLGDDSDGPFEKKPVIFKKNHLDSGDVPRFFD